MGQQHLHQPEMRRQEQKVALKVIPEVMEMRRQEQEVTREVALEVMKIIIYQFLSILQRFKIQLTLNYKNFDIWGSYTDHK